MRKPPNILDEWNGYPEIFSFSQALEISRQYLLLRTVILGEMKYSYQPSWVFSAEETKSITYSTGYIAWAYRTM